MEKTNYQRVMEEEIRHLTQQGQRPSLLLHSCCGPCSSYVLECLSAYFDVTLYFYNPNIWPEEEYRHRLREQRRLLQEMFQGRIGQLEATYDPDAFLAMAGGMEEEPEGGERCTRCFRLRLARSAQAAAQGGFAYYTTTLSVSPHKDVERINAIGAEMGERYGVRYLFSDFKKKDGYKRSVLLSREYGLYRQNYCGCRFSFHPAES